ncbi:MAG: DUF2520 domain-containing protein [Bacteroidota bacterium]
MKAINSIILIGSGNVATQLGIALKQKGKNILQVYSQNINHARVLGGKLEAPHTNNIRKLYKFADLYIVCVSDSVIEPLLNTLTFNHKLVVHTSGSISMDVFNDNFQHCGVFYPFQVFSKKGRANFGNIPMMIEAKLPDDTKRLMQLAELLSDNVKEIDSEQRRWYHLAAVFACNFSNFMYMAAEEVLQKKEMDFSLLYPLIKETAKNAIKSSPAENQRGPAIREDRPVVENHLDMLNYDKDLREIYRNLTNAIIINKHRK